MSVHRFTVHLTAYIFKKMDLKAKIQDVYTWADETLKGGNKPYFALHRAPWAGDALGLKITAQEFTDFENMWANLESNILRANQNGINRFNVVIAKGGLKDGNRYVYPGGLDLTPANNSAGIYGTAPAAPQGYGDIGAVNSLKDEVAELKMQLIKKDHDHQLEKMQEAIEGLAQSRKDTWDRVLEFVETIGERMPWLENVIVAKLTAGQPMPQNVSMGGIHGTIVREKPAQPGDTVTEEIEDINEEEAKGIDAVRMLQAANIPNAGDKLLQLIQLYIQNRTLVEGFLKQRKNETQE